MPLCSAWQAACTPTQVQKQPCFRQIPLHLRAIHLRCSNLLLRFRATQGCLPPLQTYLPKKQLVLPSLQPCWRITQVRLRIKQCRSRIKQVRLRTTQVCLHKTQEYLHKKQLHATLALPIASLPHGIFVGRCGLPQSIFVRLHRHCAGATYYCHRNTEPHRFFHRTSVSVVSENLCFSGNQIVYQHFG